MKKGQVFKVQGKNYKIIKEYRDSFLAISELGFNLKRIPKLMRIK